MAKRVLATLVAVALMSAAAGAQQQAPARAGGAGEQAAAIAIPKAPDARRANVGVELTITDQTGSAEPVKKVVTMIVADGRTGSIRSSGIVTAPAEGPAGSAGTERRPVTLNVDASPVLASDNSILLSMTLEYLPRPETGEDTRGRAQLNQRMGVTLESGKPMVISRAADPGSNRRITVEVTATVLK
jgi:hypothetical protein